MTSAIIYCEVASSNESHLEAHLTEVTQYVLCSWWAPANKRKLGQSRSKCSFFEIAYDEDF